MCYKRQELTADKTRQGLWAVGADDFPGSLLIRIGLGRDSVARHAPWEEMNALTQVQLGGCRIERASAYTCLLVYLIVQKVLILLGCILVCP